MMKSVVWMMFALALNAHAQGGGTIAGRILDAVTKAPLELANVQIEGSSKGAVAARDGSFFLEDIPVGRHVLVVSFVGYSPVRRSIEITPARPTILDILLSPAILPGQTIVVTATRGRERETPVTFSTFEASELARRYDIQDIPQLLSELPSSTFYSENGNGIGYNYLNIRGFDQRRISVMVNGIPQNDPEDHNVYWLDLPDLAANLQDIQVQRGAGSSFNGPPAIGGSVNLITSGFTGQSGLEFSSGIGTSNTRKYSVDIQSGLIDNRYSLRARLSRILSDGYRERSWADFSSYYLSAVRYDESMTTQLNFFGGPVADHLAYYGISKAEALSKDESVRRRNPIARTEEIENFSQPHYELLHEWRVTDGVTVNNALFLVTGQGFFDYDGSWAPFSYYRLTSQNGFSVPGDPDTLYSPNALIRAWVGNTQFGWLPRATMKHENGEVTFGAELRQHRSFHWGSLRWGENLPSGVTPEYRYYQYRGGKDIFSLYVHDLYWIRPDLGLMVDVQYVYNKYKLYDELYLGNEFSVPYHFLNPRVGLNYNPTDRLNIYAQVSRTSREPRLKNLYDAAEASTPASWGAIEPQFKQTEGGAYDFTKPLVKPESLIDFEVGVGYAMEGLKFTANGFSMDFTNEIVKSGQLDRFGQPITGNASKTRHIGIELSAEASVSGFEVHGNMTMSKNRLVRYTVYDAGGTPKSLNGRAIAGFPDALFNIGLSYALDGFSGSIAVQHVGEFYTDNFQDPDKSQTASDRTVDPHTVVHAWLNYRIPIGSSGESVETRLQLNNVLDAVYAAHGEGADFFPAARQSVFASLRIRL